MSRIANASIEFYCHLQFTFFRDSRPIAGSASATAAAATARVVPDVGRAGYGVRPESESRGPSSAAEAGPVGTVPVSVRTGDGQRAIRTVVLPGGAYDRSDSLTMQVDSLRRQVGELQQLCEDRAAAYGRDRETLQDQHGRKVNADAVAIRQLEHQLDATKHKLTALTKGECSHAYCVLLTHCGCTIDFVTDGRHIACLIRPPVTVARPRAFEFADYLLQRHSFNTTERQLREQLAQSKAAQESAEQEAAAVSQQADAEVSGLRKQVEAAKARLKAELGTKATTHNDAVKFLKAQWSGEKDELQARINKLSTALKSSNAKYAALERRRKGDLEGFSHDISTMRRALRQLETQFALVGGVIADAALEQQAQLMQQQADELNARLAQAAAQPINEEPEAEQQQYQQQHDNEDAANEPEYWLPSRAASMPPFTVNIKPGRASSSSASSTRTRATQQQQQHNAQQDPGSMHPSGLSNSASLGRNTLAGYRAVDYAARELAEAQSMPGQPLPGDVDYQQLQPRSTSSAVGEAAFPGVSPYTAARRRVAGRVAVATASSAPATGVPGYVISPGAGPMDIDEEQGQEYTYGADSHDDMQSPPRAARSQLGSSQLPSSGQRGQAVARATPDDRTSPATTASSSSKSSTGGPRRVPRGSPQAAPLYDSRVVHSPSDDVSAQNASNDSLQQRDYQMERQSQHAAAASRSPPAPESRTYAIRDQLLSIQNRIQALDARAAGLAGMQF